MKLESIKTYVVGNPPPGFGGRYFVFVKIRTTCGIEGVGEEPIHGLAENWDPGDGDSPDEEDRQQQQSESERLDYRPARPAITTVRASQV